MITRLMIYFKEMFPVSNIMGTIITAVAIQLIYLRLFDILPEYSFLLILPGIYLTSITLLIRVMDEFKDYQDDLTNFPNRPLPSGRVRKKDLIILGWFCVFIAVFVSLFSLSLIGWSLLTLCFTGLMLKWFFIEARMRKSLPLAFISHHPIVLFNFVYIMLFCSYLYPQVDLSKWFWILPLCTVFTNWEIERKIRAPEQETAYTTYSKIWGPRVAAFVALGLQIIFVTGSFCIFLRLESPMWFLAVAGFIQILLLIPVIHFLLTLKLAKPLKIYAEGQILITILTILIAAIL